MFPSEQPEPMITLGLNDPVKTDQTPPPAADMLQFRKAEMEEPGSRICAVCRQPVSAEYYQVNGADACGSCARQLLTIQKRRGGWPEFGRAALFGLGAAIAGSLLFAVVTYALHMTLSLLSIVVGVMVAKAVLYGSRGCRGRRFQVLAVLLTYGSITSSYIPELIAGFSKAQKARPQTTTQEKSAPVPSAAQKTSGVQLALGLVFLLLFSLIVPFLALTSGWGWINLLIIGIGLMRAWRGTQSIQAVILGPYPATQPA